MINIHCVAIMIQGMRTTFTCRVSGTALCCCWLVDEKLCDGTEARILGCVFSRAIKRKVDFLFPPIGHLQRQKVLDESNSTKSQTVQKSKFCSRKNKQWFPEGHSIMYNELIKVQCIIENVHHTSLGADLARPTVLPSQEYKITALVNIPNLFCDIP